MAIGEAILVGVLIDRGGHISRGPRSHSYPTSTHDWPTPAFPYLLKLLRYIYS